MIHFKSCDWQLRTVLQSHHNMHYTVEKLQKTHYILDLLVIQQTFVPE